MSKKKTAWIVVMLLILFALVRLPGLDVPYHQDEWKNVSASQSVATAGTFFAHPPLQQIGFVAANKLFGDGLMRLFPLLFGIAGAVLLYLVMRRRAGQCAALWSVLLYTISFYGVFASLMIDVDGAVLPFFFLLAVYAYDRFLERESALKWRWFLLLVLALMLGFLFKLSFVLVVGAFFLDYLWQIRKEIDMRTQTGVRRLGAVIGTAVGFGLLYAMILLLIEKVYPAFSISFMFGHAGQYSEGTGRNLMQIVVQGVKAVYYMSPLILLLPLWMNRETLRRTSVFWIYLLCGFLFYFVLFDFSGGALDKYLMFMIVPFCAIGGLILDEVFKNSSVRHFFGGHKIWIAFAVVAACIVFALNFIPHSAVPLYPKTEWFSRVLRGEWNVLTPLTGGNGPMGFYVSFLFIAVSYLVSSAAIIAGWLRTSWRPAAATVLIVISLVYNGVFAEEFYAGKINGSSAAVLLESINYIERNQAITNVVTFNDAGAYNLSVIGKYAGRFYAAPQFEEGHRAKFAEFDGHYLVVGIPPLYKGFYSDFFSKCDTLHETQSGAIAGRVYSCKHSRP